jgi:Fe-S-cluster containining protein
VSFDSEVNVLFDEWLAIMTRIVTGFGEMMEPWYREGLRFRCTRCGHCCTGAPGYVWVNDEEIAAIAAFRGESVSEVTALYTRPTHRGPSLREKTNGDCVFYDKALGCTVYEHRPRQCRTWPFWESNLMTPEAWNQTCQVCPGSGQGELISAEEITQRLKVIRI